DATTRSHICTNAQPPAYATPLTAAITGFATWIFTLSVGRKFRGKVPSLRDAISLRSAPAQNAFSPAPVRIATRALSSLANRSQAAANPSRTALLIALRDSGRLMVTR